MYLIMFSQGAFLTEFSLAHIALRRVFRLYAFLMITHSFKFHTSKKTKLLCTMCVRPNSVTESPWLDTWWGHTQARIILSVMFVAWNSVGKVPWLNIWKHIPAKYRFLVMKTFRFEEIVYVNYVKLRNIFNKWNWL